jgi:hypothetical protein
MAAPWPTENSYDWDTTLKAYLDDPLNHDAVVAALVASLTSTTNANLKKELRPTPKMVVETGKFWLLAGPGAVATQLLVQSQEVAVPFEVVSPVSITELDVEVTTAAASSFVRLGIRSHNPLTGEPLSAAPLVDAGQIDSSTTGVKPKVLGTPLVLQPGWYWYTVTAQGGAPTVRASPDYSLIQPMPLKGATAAALSAATAGGYYQSGVTAALPSTWASTLNVAANVPRVIAKAA